MSREPNWIWWDNGWSTSSTFEDVNNSNWERVIQISNDDWGCPIYVGSFSPLCCPLEQGENLARAAEEIPF